MCNSCQSFKLHWPLSPKPFNFGHRCFGFFRYSLTQGIPSRSLVRSSCYILYIYIYIYTHTHTHTHTQTHTYTHTHTHTKNCHGFLQSDKLNGVTVQLFWTFHEWHDWKYAALDREWLEQVGSVHQTPCLLITTNKQCSGPFSLVPLVLWQSFWVQLSAWAGHWNMCFIRGHVFSFHGVTRLLVGPASSQSCCQFVIQLVAAGIRLSLLLHQRGVW